MPKASKITNLKKTINVPPFARKALIWGGAAVGLIAAGALAFVVLTKDEETESDSE